MGYQVIPHLLKRAVKTTRSAVARALASAVARALSTASVHAHGTFVYGVLRAFFSSRVFLTCVWML